MSDISITSNYAGANIRVVHIQDDVVSLEQELRDSTDWWFYWSFAVEAAQDRMITFKFTNGEVIGPWGPSVSKDGVEWEWLDPSRQLTERTSFQYHLQPGRKVYFSYCIPYQLHRKRMCGVSVCSVH